MAQIDLVKTTQIIKDLLTYNAQVKDGQKVLIVYDEDSDVSKILKDAYESSLKEIQKSKNRDHPLQPFFRPGLKPELRHRHIE